MSESIHQRIRRLRLARNMSMQDLAAACGVNSWQSIQQWESGKTSPKLGRFTRLAKALGVSESELLGDASGSKSLNMREADKKKSRITDEHREESRRLKAIYDQRKADGRLKMTQAQIGAEYGIGTQAMVGHCLSGRAAMTLPTAVAWAKLLCCEVADFSPRLAARLANARTPGTSRNTGLNKSR